MRFEPAVALPVTRQYIVAPGQNIAVGDPVTLNESGAVEKASAASNAILGIAASSVVTGEADVNRTIMVWVGDDRNEFYGECDGAPSLSLLGQVVDISIDSGTGEPRIDVDANTVGHLLITGTHPYRADVLRFKINPDVSLFTK